MERKQLPRQISKQAQSKIDTNVWGEDTEMQAAWVEQERAMQEAVDAASTFVRTVENQTGWRSDDPRFTTAWQALIDALELCSATSWR
jgi:hypothetical protein